jgi:hypothetical protein
MTRAAHWLRIGLACGLLWAGAAVATPTVRAQTSSYAAASGPAAPAAAVRGKQRVAPAIRAPRSPERPPHAPLDRRPAQPTPHPRVLRPARTHCLYLRHCVLLR